MYTDSDNSDIEYIYVYITAHISIGTEMYTDLRSCEARPAESLRYIVYIYYINITFTILNLLF